MIIKLLLYLFLLANCHALWEIQIEKGDGWAKNLPCWRLHVFFRKLLGGKPLTGYHFWMLILWQMFFHSPFIFIDWSWKVESIVQGLFFWYFIFQDALWFVWNPHYTLKRFRKQSIEWHKRWLWGFPLSYWVGGIIGSWLILLGR